MQASITSPRLCGGMLVAMPTAMPLAPLTSRFGKRAGRTVGSCAAVVVVGLEIDRVLVDVVQQRVGGAWRGAPRCSASPPADRRPSSRNCPGRRSAAGAWRNPAPCAPWRRRSRVSPCGWYLPITSPTMRADLRNGAVPVVAAFLHGVEDAPMHRLQAVAHVGQRARHDHAHGVIEVGALHLLFDGNGRDVERRRETGGRQGVNPGSC